MDNPLYDVVLALHVASVVVGFGAVGITGWYAAALRRDPASSASERLRRYFRPGTNWAARAMLLVPIFGAMLLALGHGQDVGQPYPWIGLALWVAATGLVTGVVWPGERTIQAAVAGAAPGQMVAGEVVAGEVVAGEALAGEVVAAMGLGLASVAGALPTSAAELAAICRRVDRAAAATSLLVVAAAAVMIVQPG